MTQFKPQQAAAGQRQGSGVSGAHLRFWELVMVLLKIQMNANDSNN